MKVFTRPWWRAAGERALYTGVAALIPVAGQIGTGNVDWGYAGGLVGLAVVLSLATSLASLPELKSGKAAFWKAVVYRAVRTLGQGVAAGIGSTLLIQDVDWRVVAGSVAGMVAVTVLRTALSHLPEAAAPKAITE